MVQAGGGFCFEAKALHVRFCCPVSETNHFERHYAVKAFLVGAINYALAAASDFFQQFVIAEILRHSRTGWPKRLVIFVVE
jgi:hypothetical protein